MSDAIGLSANQINEDYLSVLGRDADPNTLAAWKAADPTDLTSDMNAVGSGVSLITARTWIADGNGATGDLAARLSHHAP